MTKEITKAHILQEVEDKFKLREFAPAHFLFDETVVPIYNIGPHLSKYTVKHHSISVTSLGGKLFFTVPQNERWTLRAYQIIFGATGPHKGTGLYIANRPAATDMIYLDMTKGQEVSYLVNLPDPVVLDHKNQLYYYIDTYVSTQSLTVDIDVKVEEIR